MIGIKERKESVWGCFGGRWMECGSDKERMGRAESEWVKMMGE